MSRILTPREIKPRRPDSLADDPVLSEPVSHCNKRAARQSGGAGACAHWRYRTLARGRGVEQNNPLEAMLTAQMGVIHTAIMTFGERLSHGTLAQQDSAERALNKLARTFTMQVEALSDRRGTEGYGAARLLLIPASASASRRHDWKAAPSIS
jgi:hypothetical protein